MELLTYLSSLSIPNLFSRMPAAAAQGIIWGIMALGVYITFRLLNVSDLTPPAVQSRSCCFCGGFPLGRRCCLP